ncbi:MAG: hypothetical protein IMZ47_09575 [Firmicutes bacterium]|nr:hypothetical protein [Bacillota bacterium]
MERSITVIERSITPLLIIALGLYLIMKSKKTTESKTTESKATNKE